MPCSLNLRVRISRVYIQQVFKRRRKKKYHSSQKQPRTFQDCSMTSTSRKATLQNYAKKSTFQDYSFPRTPRKSTLQYSNKKVYLPRQQHLLPLFCFSQSATFYNYLPTMREPSTIVTQHQSLYSRHQKKKNNMKELRES